MSTKQIKPSEIMFYAMPGRLNCLTKKNAKEIRLDTLTRGMEWYLEEQFLEFLVFAVDRKSYTKEVYKLACAVPSKWI